MRVLDPVARDAVRRERPDRVINSRMVRRRKPHEGTFQKPKAKSRWCVLGHQDSDAADMFTYAPAPQTESIMLFFFLLQACDLTLSIADLKNAFVSQIHWIGPQGLCLWIRARTGPALRISLIQLVAPVYGLNDVPLRWHRTLTCWLVKQGNRKSLLVPCLFTHYALGGSVDGLILIEVDDFVIGAKRSQETEFQQMFQAAFCFGKWQKREVSYAGRRIPQRDQYVFVDQEQYILEKFQPVPLPEKRQKDRRVDCHEFEQVARLCIRSIGLPRRVVRRLRDLHQC